MARSISRDDILRNVDAAVLCPLRAFSNAYARAVPSLSCANDCSRRRVRSIADIMLNVLGSLSWKWLRLRLVGRARPFLPNAYDSSSGSPSLAGRGV